MTEPRVRACHPPRMAVLVDGHEFGLVPASDYGPRIDVVHETAYLGPRVAVTMGNVAQPGFPPVAPRIDERDRALAHVLVQAGAAMIQDADITPIVPSLVPIEPGWVSPTLGTIPPGGVAPGEPLSPHCHDRPAEPAPAVVDVAAVERVLAEPAVTLRSGWLGRALARTLGGGR